MTDTTDETAEPRRELAVQQKARTPVVGGGHVVALIPQSLEEAYRLAEAMSRSNLTPYNIKTPEAVLLCMMAGSELGFAPYQSLQSFAVFNNRPCLYGDAIPALLWSKGFDIDEMFEGEDVAFPDDMKAVCTVTRPNGKVVTRSFSVADAKTAKLWGKRGKDGQDTPWITMPKRMLQMRARGFAARDGASEVLRGLPIYEEQRDVEPIRDEVPNTGTGMVARLQARPAEVNPDGFNVNKVTAETDKAKPPGRKKAADKAQEEPKAGESAPAAETASHTPASATDASTGSAEETSSQPEPDAVSNDGDTATPEPQDAEFEDAPDGDSPDAGLRLHADPGEAYLLASEPEGPDGKWTLYKDGQGFSRVGTKGYDRFPVCREHAPPAPDKGYATINEDFIDDDLPEGLRAKPAAQDPEPEIRTSPEDRKEPAAPTGLIGELRPMTSWLQIKPRVVQLYKDDDFQALDADDQAQVRRNIWAEVQRVKEQHRDPLDWAEDPTAFRLWMETQMGKDGADAIEGTFRVLCKSVAFTTKLSEETRKGFTATVENHIAKLRGAK